MRLGERERGALALVEERALAPGGEREDAAVLLAGLLGVDGVHVDAEGAAVDLRGADAHELAQARLEAGARVERGDRAIDVARGAGGRRCGWSLSWRYRRLEVIQALEPFRMTHSLDHFGSRPAPRAGRAGRAARCARGCAARCDPRRAAAPRARACRRPGRSPAISACRAARSSRRSRSSPRRATSRRATARARGSPSSRPGRAPVRAGRRPARARRALQLQPRPARPHVVPAGGLDERAAAGPARARRPRRSATAIPRGRRELREQLASYLARARGVAPIPSSWSSARASATGSRSSRAPCAATGAERCAIEDPCVPQHRAAVAASGLALAAACRSTRAARARTCSAGTPRWPSSRRRTSSRRESCCASDRRAAAVAWATATGGADRRGRLRRRVPLRPPAGRRRCRRSRPTRRLRRHGARRRSSRGCGSAGSSSRRACSSRSRRCAAAEDVHVPALDQIALCELLARAATSGTCAACAPATAPAATACSRCSPSARPRSCRSGISAGLGVLLELPAGGPTAAELLRRGCAADRSSSTRSRPHYARGARAARRRRGRLRRAARARLRGGSQRARRSARRDDPALISHDRRRPGTAVLPPPIGCGATTALEARVTT